MEDGTKSLLESSLSGAFLNLSFASGLGLNMQLLFPVILASFMDLQS